MANAADRVLAREAVAPRTRAERRECMGEHAKAHRGATRIATPVTGPVARASLLQTANRPPDKYYLPD